MYTTIKLQNTSHAPQSIMYRGERLFLNPGEVMRYDEGIAKKFLEKCAPAVSVVDDSTSASFDNYMGPVKWLANVTGNPALPEELVKIKRVRPHVGAPMQDMEVRVPNPLRKPVSLSRSAEGAQVEYIDSWGQYAAWNRGKQVIRLDPYERRPFPLGVADWFLNRQNLSGMPGACIESRPPTSFEPSLSWKLENIRMYLKFIQPGADLGPTEEEVIKNTKKLKGRKFSQDDADMAVNGAVRELFGRVWPMLCDPAYRLPSLEEFEEFLVSQAPIVEQTVEQTTAESPAAQV
jgi:hypothetical protein